MPTYSYKCDACGHRFEQLQSIKDDPLTSCPSCGEEQLRRLIGAGAGLIFKGSGFYQTDYVRKSPAEDSKPKGAADKQKQDQPAKAESKDSGASSPPKKDKIKETDR